MNPDHFPRDILEILTNQNIADDFKAKVIEAFEQTKREQEQEQTKREREREQEQTKREQEQEQTKRTWLYIFHKENWVNL
jgi:hypothetical protein